MISPDHANFIVNTGNASARDVLYLTHVITGLVALNTEFKFEAEVCFVSVCGTIMPVDKAI